MIAGLLEIGIGILQAREIGRARPRAEVAEQRISVRLVAQGVDARFRRRKIAEIDRARRTRRLAGGDDLALAGSPRSSFSAARRARLMRWTQ